jgi:hypothetical protein
LFGAGRVANRVGLLAKFRPNPGQWQRHPEISLPIPVSLAACPAISPSVGDGAP